MFVVARILLIINALLYLLVGFAVAIQPGMMEAIGIDLVSATGVTTTRTWGALFAGAGLTALLTAIRHDWVIVGLWLLAIMGVSIFSTRVFGLFVDGIEPRQWIELRREGVGCAIALLGLGLGLAARRRRVTNEF
jgi:hypothetical protein